MAAGSDILVNSRHTTDSFGMWDYTVVGVYFMVIVTTGFIAMFRADRSTVSGYFLAGRFMTWIPVGASVFASNIGSEHFIGLAGAGAAIGLGVGAFELNALLILQLCGWVFLPVFISSKVCTLPGYISKRFGGTRLRTYLAILSMFLYIFTKISVNLYSGAIFIQQTIGWNIYPSIITLLAVTSICTVTGGLTAVMYTESMQSVIMIVGSGILSVIGLVKIGGIGQLFPKYMAAVPSSIPANMTECAYPKENSFQMLRSLDDHDMPWLGFVLGQTPVSIWYWCADQIMVQRLMAAKSLTHAQGGALFAGYLKILPLFLIIIPGMISRILYPDEVACVDPVQCMQYCNNPNSCTNTAYTRLVLGLLPSPLKGLIMSVMLGALMSDLSSIFNSSSTLFTCDIWPLIRKQASTSELMIVGRAFVLVMIGVSIAWVPVIEAMQNGQLYLYIQDVGSNLAPPIAAVYILAVLSKRINEPGAFWSLMLGLVIGISRLLANLFYLKPDCGSVDLRPILLKVHFMYFALFLFAFTVIVCTVISLLTSPPNDDLLIRTTYWTRFDESKRRDEITTTIKVCPEMDKIVPLISNTNTNDAKLYKCEKLDKPMPSVFTQFVTWFCSIESSESEESGNNNFESNFETENMFSIKQDITERKYLLVNLLIVFCITVSLFVVLSIPGWWLIIS